MVTRTEQQIRKAQHRLWLNRWGYTAAVSTTLTAGAFALVALFQRLFDMAIPVPEVGVGLCGAAFLASIVWTAVRRESLAAAAAILDQAAGLRERLSSSQYCLTSEDPFARAVVADAERFGASISVRQHIRLTVPRPLGFTIGSIVLAAATFLVPQGLLKSSEAVEVAKKTAEREETKIAVKRQLEEVRKLAEPTPVAWDLKEDLENLDKLEGGRLERPADIRHEALKKIDKLEDAIKQKRASDQYDAVPELRKTLRGLKVPKTSEAPTQKLAKALNEGDFKTAKEEIQSLKEQLATLKSEEDKELVQKMSQQLDELAKQLEKLRNDEKLAQKLEQSGLKKEDVERLLERLNKEDLEQLKKQLEEKGLNQQQIEKIAKQLQQRQNAGSAAKKLAQGMKQAAASSSAGQTGEAMDGLTKAEQQLSELEQLEQEMNQLDSTMAALQDAKNNLDKPCPSCNGTGTQDGQRCARCSGGGGSGGMGPLGQGRGGRAPEEPTDTAFKIERGKVHTGKGAIVGQFLFEGEQVKGDVPSSFTETVSAAEREASDLIHRDRVPRQYHKAVKAYFSSIQESVKREPAQTGATPSDAPARDSTGQPHNPEKGEAGGD